jgi:hypothetical protein
MKLANKKTIYDQDLLSLVPQMAVSNWQLAFSFWPFGSFVVVPSLGLYELLI